ncbi:hypothetical protein BB560_001829 [Smittium megazygosporum]|uniref:Uncharacterized protein n=1 Tax=Smittium megazygosporum TaxID=133381 RepID=A0A2T9ZGG0_9FUNG|nr:hypothetical protein BB560_001829 [Smittium megazygosporum]
MIKSAVKRSLRDLVYYENTAARLRRLTAVIRVGDNDNTPKQDTRNHVPSQGRTQNVQRASLDATKYQRALTRSPKKESRTPTKTPEPIPNKISSENNQMTPQTSPSVGKNSTSASSTGSRSSTSQRSESILRTPKQVYVFKNGRLEPVRLEEGLDIRRDSSSSQTSSSHGFESRKETKKYTSPKQDESRKETKKYTSPKQDESRKETKKYTSPRQDESGKITKKYTSPKQDESRKETKKYTSPRQDESRKEIKKYTSPKQDGSNTFQSIPLNNNNGEKTKNKGKNILREFLDCSKNILHLRSSNKCSYEGTKKNVSKKEGTPQNKTMPEESLCKPKGSESPKKECKSCLQHKNSMDSLLRDNDFYRNNNKSLLKKISYITEEYNGMVKKLEDERVNAYIERRYYPSFAF